MNNPCTDCSDKVEDEYGLLCDLSCGKHTVYINYQSGIKEVVGWIKINLPDEYGSIKEWSVWQAKVKEWGC